jgi:hypothetical protein
MLVVRNGKIDDKGLSPFRFETSRLLTNTAWCGRRDAGMILNPNDGEVAPPHTRGVSVALLRTNYQGCASKEY